LIILETKVTQPIQIVEISFKGSLFGISGRFPPHYVGCVMTGQALGGVIPAAAAVGLIAFEVRPDLLGKRWIFLSFYLGLPSVIKKK